MHIENPLLSIHTLYEIGVIFSFNWWFFLLHAFVLVPSKAENLLRTWLAFTWPLLLPNGLLQLVTLIQGFLDISCQLDSFTLKSRYYEKRSSMKTFNVSAIRHTSLENHSVVMNIHCSALFYGTSEIPLLGHKIRKVKLSFTWVFHGWWDIDEQSTKS